LQAFERVWNVLIARITGDAWKQTEKVIDALRQGRYPELLVRRS
jgi:hypothetical protein